MHAKRRICSPLHWPQCFATTLGLIEGWFVASFNWISRYCFWVGTLQTNAVRKGRLWDAVCCARETFRQRLAKSNLSSKGTRGGSGDWRARVPRAGSLCGLARAWDGDSESTEGLNSRVRQRTQKAPNLGLDTLNANIENSSTTQLGTKDAPQGWSALKFKTSSRVPHGRARV